MRLEWVWLCAGFCFSQPCANMHIIKDWRKGYLKICAMFSFCRNCALAAPIIVSLCYSGRFQVACCLNRQHHVFGFQIFFQSVFAAFAADA